jgi:hypothetical protein
MADLDRDLNAQVAKMVGAGTDLDAVANAIAETARANYSGHGTASTYIHVEKGRIDRRVTFDHPQASYLEMGHLMVNRRTGKKTMRWIRGIHGLRNAARTHGGY